MAKFRVLGLHGWRTNGNVLKAQLTGLLHGIGREQVEIVCLNAPFPAKGDPFPEITQFFGSGPYYEWWDHQKHERENQPTQHEYVGLEHSLRYLQRVVMEQGPFDVVVGFSQGAAMATILTSFYLQNTSERIVPYHAVLLVCGFIPRYDEFPREQRLDFPSIHVIGEQDPILEMSKQLHDELYAPSKRTLFIHPDGHRFPALPVHRQMYTEIAQILRTLCHVDENE